jgi:hypothetical protein
MFPIVPLSIVRSSSLYTQQWYMSHSFADSLQAGSEFHPDPACELWSPYPACMLWKTPDNGQRNCPKHIKFDSKNKFEKLVHLVGFNIQIYHDARLHERQIKLYGRSKDRTLSVETVSLCLSVCDRLLSTKPLMDYYDTPVAYKLVKNP